MKAVIAAITLGTILTGGVWTARVTAMQEIISGTDASAAAAVADVVAQDGTVTGVLINKSDRPLHDVQLLIRRGWLWDSERHPGAKSPGRAEFYTFPGPLLPGTRTPFTYHAPSPLPVRSGGHFTTSVEVVGFTRPGE